MGQTIWITGATSVVAVICAVAISKAAGPGKLASAEVPSVVTRPLAAPEGYAEPDVGSAIAFTLSNGSALATAAFGMAALHPETYNGEIVLDLIQASPLPLGEKSRLKRQLYAANAGRADLSVALSNVRVALALE